MRIDPAIAATRKEISLLREYRIRLIADVVTGKVDVREVGGRLPDGPGVQQENGKLDDLYEANEAVLGNAEEFSEEAEV